MKASIKIASDFVKDHKKTEITMVGHSKGGAEATANAVATNKNCIVFNPADPNLGAYGLNASNCNKSLISYVVKGEILSYVEGVDKMLWSVRFLKQQYGSVCGNLSIQDRINNHSMDSVIAGLGGKV